MHIPSPLDVQEAADMLVRCLARSSIWGNTSITIVGGAALQHYMTQPSAPPIRITNNLDVIVRDNVHGGSVHDSLVQDLLQCDHDRFFTYKKHDGGLQTQTGVRVRFCEERELHYQPSGFLPIVQAWRSGITPYVPVEDLLLHKITSAPLRALRRDRFNDAKDALYLVKSVPGIQPPKIRLSPQQRVDIDECIQEFVPYSTEPEQFWRDILQI